MTHVYLMYLDVFIAFSGNMNCLTWSYAENTLEVRQLIHSLYIFWADCMVFLRTCTEFYTECKYICSASFNIFAERFFNVACEITVFTHFISLTSTKFISLNTIIILRT